MSSLKSLESAALILLGAMIILSVWGWASGKIDMAKESSLDDRNTSLTCSGLEIDFVDREENSTHTTVYFSSNKNIELLEARFKGRNSSYDTNVTGLKRNQLRAVSGPVPDAEVMIEAPKCK